MLSRFFAPTSIMTLRLLTWSNSSVLLPHTRRYFQRLSSHDNLYIMGQRNFTVTYRTSDLENNDARKDLSYQKTADTLLQDLYDQLEAADELNKFMDSVDLTDDGVLEIRLIHNKGTIVLNKHYVHRQIWYSSPNSGADYFPFASSSSPWISKRTQLTVRQQLSKDIRDLTSVNVILNENVP